ncbi:MAG TPA: hypothetical protein VM434_12260 [Beijerinckiaceae bacterium]|nr:hypothetical protein [Beijerinckiaceae bacterium]
MLVGASEGQGWRYEVFQHNEGYLVRSRDLDSGEVEEAEGRVFRTAAVAFAYADMSAAFDRYAAARIDGETEEAEACLAELESRQALFGELSRRLSDEGLALVALAAWVQADESAHRRRYH